MPKTLIVHLVRHGLTPWNKTNKCMGQQDIPLDEDGWAQARAVARDFQDRPVDLILSSDLKRARETAGPLSEEKGIQPVYDCRLREICYGELEGWTPEEWPVQFPDLMQTWSFSSFDIPPPGGECRGELIRRTSQVLEEQLETDAKNVVLVTHGGVVMALLSHIVLTSANLPVNRSLGVFKVGNGSVTTLTWKQGRWRIQEVNRIPPPLT